MSCFIGGLKADIKHDVCGQRPLGIMESYWYAKTYEKAAASRSVIQSYPAKQRSSVPLHIPHKQMGNTAHNTDKSTNTAGPRPPNLCWYCREPWNRQHKCRIGKTIHILQKVEEETSDQTTETPTLPELQYHTAPNTPDKETPPQTCCQISIHAAEGTPGPATLCILIKLAGKQAVALVDSGSSDTFMNYQFVVECNYSFTPTNIRKVSVAGGGQLISDSVIKDCNYSISGKNFNNTFKVLPLQTYDIILGADWLKQFSPVNMNFIQRILVINWKNKPFLIKDYTGNLSDTSCTPEQAEKVFKKGVMGYFIQINLIRPVEEKQQVIPEPIQNLLEFYESVFEEPVGLPPIRDVDHKIELIPGATPPNIRPYRVPHYQKSAMEEIIQDLLIKQEIQPSLSPFSSLAVMVRKKDGGWRLCNDFRQLNAKTVKNKFPMPIIEDLLDELHGAKYFSKIDLRSGFHQIRMATPDIPKTAFRTHMGHYEYIVMPFGLTNAPTTFQNLMNIIFGTHRKFILVFFDDVLIFSMTLEEHVQHLQIALDLLRVNCLSVKRSKCEFAVTEVKYLGHVLSVDGVATDPCKVQDILNWPSS